MKIIKKILLCFGLLFVVCSCNKVEKNLQCVVGEYHMLQLDDSSLKNNPFEYYNITLKNDYTLILEYKQNKVEVYQKGNWLLNDDRTVITFFVSEDNVLLAKEYAYDFDNQNITITYNDNSTLKLTK